MTKTNSGTTSSTSGPAGSGSAGAQSPSGSGYDSFNGDEDGAMSMGISVVGMVVAAAVALF